MKTLRLRNQDWLRKTSKSIGKSKYEGSPKIIKEKGLRRKRNKNVGKEMEGQRPQIFELA